MELKHHGIKGQKWGKRNGPPYPLKGGQYSETEEKEEFKRTRLDNSSYNKIHFDKVVDANTTLSTLSYDKNRTKDTDMFYAAYDKKDKAQYMAMFNKPIKDFASNVIYKSRINNKVKESIKVASEDSGAEIFRKLYSKSRDFYNFVTDPKRLQKAFNDDKYKFRGYREARAVLEKMRQNVSFIPTDKEVQIVYRMFNYVLPFADDNNKRLTDDIKTQRNKFFSELKKEGYGAVLDTNDALYGGYKANSPIIVFDIDKIIPSDIRNTTFLDTSIAKLEYVGRKIVGRLK